MYFFKLLLYTKFYLVAVQVIIKKTQDLRKFMGFLRKELFYEHHLTYEIYVNKYVMNEV